MQFRTRMWGAGRMVVLGGALFATFIVFFLVSLSVASKAREVRVPDISGKSIPEAQALMANAGLEVRMDPVRRPDLKVPADHVLTQDPAAGTVLRRGRTIRVRVSDGAKLPALPNLTGASEREAQMRLSQDQITVAGITEIRASEAAAGTVIAQDPPARSQSRSIQLLINRGAEGLTYVMPDLIGAPEGRVTDLLRTRGFRIAIVGHTSYPGLPGGVIIRQTPQAGYQIAPGESVSLEISR